jgi:pimeloyl-ACP methyl ester carboxylesterase
LRHKINSKLKLYCISGLGADERVFKFLKLDFEVFPLSWIDPLLNESIEDYSIRLARAINTEEPFGIMGVSFGGLIATEISKRLNPEFTILISSAETKSDLRFSYKLAGKIGGLKWLPQKFFDMPRSIASRIFGTKSNQLLNAILDDTDLKFAKWAVIELTQWKNKTRLKNSFKIGGENDVVMPPNLALDNVIISNGEHFMIVDKADEISDIINLKYANLAKNGH